MVLSHKVKILSSITGKKKRGEDCKYWKGEGFTKGLECEDLDVKEFVDSEDFMHFLSSFKVTLEDSEEETK